MAGHSKWANIRHRKERMDNKRGKIFSRVVKEICVAAKLGGADPESNPRLRLALQKAREANLPKDNIEKAIDRGVGKLKGAVYDEVRYEGFGPDGIGVIVDCLTDNRNRTTAEVRHAFNKSGGSLGTEGSVSRMFSRMGQLLYSPERAGDVDSLVNTAIDAGAKDFDVDTDGSLEIVTEPSDFTNVMTVLEEKDMLPDSAELIMRPHNIQAVDKDRESRIRKLLDTLEECDDTQHVYSTAEFAE